MRRSGGRSDRRCTHRPMKSERWIETELDFQRGQRQRGTVNQECAIPGFLGIRLCCPVSFCSLDCRPAGVGRTLFGGNSKHFRQSRCQRSPGQILRKGASAISEDADRAGGHSRDPTYRRTNARRLCSRLGSVGFAIRGIAREPTWHASLLLRA